MSEYLEMAKSIQNVALSGVKSGEAIAEMKYLPIIKHLLPMAKEGHLRNHGAAMPGECEECSIISKAEGLL